ncbi:alcohol dehydrogenase catalytic domain-containing protein [Sulfitobacter sp. KE29]|uniref:zinc-binding dehydrogenase n=1 Tax=unclassified Sulfitobacter TaxID=196795 RepID=UPI0023E0E8C8|nr:MULTISPECIES: zinc-binding dehydrogenase [unclassified Sulfitobacter]MDF3420132.1 alcohol dehydrogenase catalytic domain-containing protein [Sulfitobacter sp. Ks38]MDF3427617.1 alcohol dehydrogenase catalytic domain-containing protein [Sulfitobacter sp. KE29]MDF3431196.1 alcohol dehydrogenase catalytic domain-containing protein [Sulfitobacter sp. S46]MDF3445969.1 alcohol dehydrogenase catalytic domain-containing protein [Sulfitobacter sp. KE31]MDF3549978.1 alcohol dehydrogenase catalytic do
MKITAAVLIREGTTENFAVEAPLEVREVDLAPPGRGEVLIRVGAAGVCHSDLSVINGTRLRPLPMVLGHEASGYVEQLGEGVDDLKVGDHVACIFAPGCRQCTPCAEGRPALCERAARHHGVGELMTGARRLSMGGQPINHHVGVSAFASHAVLDRRSLVKVDHDVPTYVSALFSCAMLTGAGAVFNTARILPGQTVAVIGLGGVGLSAVLGAAAAGAGRVVAIDPLESKMEAARSMGATDCIKADGDTIQAVRDLTNGGVDCAIELAGSVKALETAYEITRRGGLTVTAGLPDPNQHMALPALKLVAEERTLKGSYIGSCVPQRDLPRMFALYKQGKLPVEKMLSHRVRLDDINLAMDRLNDGTAIRQIVDFD